MASAFDVAAYIIEKRGPTSHMKLQKLVYYSQAWSLVWDEQQLFDEQIEAWVSGPVIRRLYALCRRLFTVYPQHLTRGSARNLTKQQKDTIDAVLEFYGGRNAQWLSDLTHMESPWQDARKGLIPSQRGTREITPAALAEYYGSL
ncbi:MAG: DUF4065 domain-containing protein [Planctomycetes bacterium]|nr:DUF4065 domain-containing protein [Planctomycetota bacterium]